MDQAYNTKKDIKKEIYIKQSMKTFELHIETAKPEFLIFMQTKLLLY